MVRIIAVAFVATLVSPAIAEQDTNSAGWLADSCASTDTGFRNGACAGYVAGVADTLTVLERICPPDGVTHGQMRKVVLKYLNDRPQLHHRYAITLVEAALNIAFPCKAQSAK
jgi:hypothetical protein